MQKYEKKYLDTWGSKKKKKKIGTHEGPKVLKKEKMSTWRLIKTKKFIAMS